MESSSSRTQSSPVPQKHHFRVLTALRRSRAKQNFCSLFSASSKLRAISGAHHPETMRKRAPNRNRVTREQTTRTTITTNRALHFPFVEARARKKGLFALFELTFIFTPYISCARGKMKMRAFNELRARAIGTSGSSRASGSEAAARAESVYIFLLRRKKGASVRPTSRVRKRGICVFAKEA